MGHEDDDLHSEMRLKMDGRRFGARAIFGASAPFSARFAPNSARFRDPSGWSRRNPKSPHVVGPLAWEAGGSCSSRG